MDKGALQATVHEVTKELDMIYQLDKSSRDNQINLSDKSNKKMSFYTHYTETGEMRRLTNGKYWREYRYINTLTVGGSVD